MSGHAHAREMGQSRHFERTPTASSLPQQADIPGDCRQVSNGPGAEVSASQSIGAVVGLALRPVPSVRASRLPAAGGLENIKVYVMTTESSASRLQRDLRRIRLSKPVGELQRSSQCDQKPLAP